jgi:hypothetical protein
VWRTIWRTRAWRNRCGCTGAGSPNVRGRRCARQHADIGLLGGSLDDLPGAHAVDRLAPTVALTLAGEEQRLVVVEIVVARSQEQIAGQAGVRGREVRRLDRSAWVLQVRQSETLATNVPRPQRQHLANAGTGGPERRQQQAVALAGSGRDDGLDVLRRQPPGGCQRLGAGLTERFGAGELNCSGRATGASTVLADPLGSVFTGREFNRRGGVSNSCRIWGSALTPTADRRRTIAPPCRPRGQGRQRRGLLLHGRGRDEARLGTRRAGRGVDTGS